MFEKRCKKITGNFLNNPIYCDGLVIVRRYMHLGKTYEFEACSVCGDSPTLDHMILKEKENVLQD